MSISQNISELITKSHFTKTEICKKTGVSRPTLDNWLSGKYYPTIDFLIKLSVLIGCSMHDFFDHDNKNYTPLDNAFENLKTELLKYINENKGK